MVRPSGRHLSRIVDVLGVFAALIVVAMASAWAEPAPGPVFQVNTYTANSQLWPAVGMNRAGRFVVAWTSYGQDGDNFGVFAQRYDASGVRLGDEFQVNTTTAGEQRQPSVAVDAVGNFVIVWSQPGATSDAIFARRYDAKREPLGPEFQVNSDSAGARFNSTPQVAMAAGGSFVVVWQGRSVDEPSGGIFARLYDATGTPLAAEFVANTTTTDVQSAPAVAMNGDARIVVAWMSHGQDAPFSLGVFGRLFTADGGRQGDEFTANTFTAGDQYEPAVALGDAGDFVIAWTSTGQHNRPEIYARWFAADGTALDVELQVNTGAGESPTRSSAAIDATGRLVTAWDSLSGEDTASMWARVFDPSRSPEGEEFLVNDTQHDPLNNAVSGSVVDTGRSAGATHFLPFGFSNVFPAARRSVSGSQFMGALSALSLELGFAVGRILDAAGQCPGGRT